MKLILRKATTVWSVSIALALLVFGLLVALVLMRPVAAQTSDPSSEGRLVTIHDRGQESVVVSFGDTIGDVLKEAEITVDVHDLVEPALSEPLVAAEYDVNIYRARPVTVVDGEQRIKLISAYQTAAQIAEVAGVSLYPEDIATLARSQDFLSDGAGLQAIIDRATPLSFELYGATSESRTQAETVGEMLDEKGIELGDAGRVAPSEDTPITSGMSIRVWREGKQTITVDQAVPFDVQQIKDADRTVDYKEIRTAGVNGTRSVTYEIEITDGVEVSRTEIASLVVTPAQTQVEVVGTKPVFVPYTGGGTKTEWLAASNIPQESWGYADFMVQRESGWRPDAINRTSGACGLAQALPCSKIPGQWNDPVNALNWMNGYVNGRYGGWAQAYDFWQKNKWY